MIFFTEQQESEWRSRASEPMTVGEYLAYERTVPIKNEFRDGRIYPMGPFDARHCLIGVSVIAAVSRQAKQLKLYGLGNQMRIRVPATNFFTYADASIVADKPAVDDNEYRDNLINPAAIIQVSSESLAGDNRGTKFAHLQQLDTLSNYLIVMEDRIQAEHYVRSSDGQWNRSDIEGAGATILFVSLGIVLCLGDFYDQVDYISGSN